MKNQFPFRAVLLADFESEDFENPMTIPAGTEINVLSDECDMYLVETLDQSASFQVEYLEIRPA